MSSQPFSHQACIGLGSNLGRSRSLLQSAWQTLADHPQVSVQKLSSPYTTQPVDMESRHWFINAAGLLITSLTPRELLSLILQVEQQFGRVRSTGLAGHQDRTLDLDLLLFDDLIMDTPELILPHPAMDKRMFVLVPLAEIAPERVHPLQRASVSALLANLQTSAEAGDIEQILWGSEGELL